MAPQEFQLHDSNVLIRDRMTPKEFEAQLQFKTDDELFQLVKDFSDRFDFEADVLYTKEDIDDMFNFHTVLRVLTDYETSATVFEGMKKAIDKYHKEGDDIDKALDFLADWSFMAMNYTDEKQDEFVCLPYYEEVLAAFRDAPEKFRAKELKVKLQMAHHFRYWLANDGDIEALEEDLRHFLVKLVEHFPEVVAGVVEQKETEGHYDDAVDLSRALYRFYHHGRKPNEAVQFLKRTIELIPNSKDYVEADTADLYMSLGRLYADHSKWETARKYFQMALDIYAKQGEDFEMFVAQAEGWIDEANFMLK